MTRQAHSSIGRNLRTLGMVLASALPLCLHAQTSSAPQAVPLVSGVCPVVHPHDWISLDWNPGFDHAGSVIGLRSFRLLFHPLFEGSANPNPNVTLLLKTPLGIRTAAAGNGYFHLEARLPTVLRPGKYQLTEAHSGPEMAPAYQGELPLQTVSPAGEHYCITVVAGGVPHS